MHDTHIDLTSVIQSVKDGLIADDRRFQVEDENHIRDTLTGYTFHFYPEKYKVTYDDNVIYTSEDLRDNVYLQENRLMDYIRKMLEHHFTEMHKQKVMENRKVMLSTYQDPKPKAEEIPALGAGTLSGNVRTT